MTGDACWPGPQACAWRHWRSRPHRALSVARRRRAPRAKGAALCVPGRRDRLRPGADLGPVFAHASRRTSSTRCTATNTSRGRCKVRAGARRRHAARCRPISRPARSASSRASTSPTTPRSAARSASSRRRTSCTRIKRHFDPRCKSPSLSDARGRRHHRPRRGAQGGARDRQVRLRHAEVEGMKALDRYTVQIKLAEPRPALHHALADRGHRRRSSRARSSRSTATRSWSTRSAPGRSSSPTGGAASKIVLEQNPNFRERRLRRGSRAADDAEGAGDREALQGQAAADGRQGGDLDHRGAAAALARLPERRARPASGGAEEFTTVAMPNDKLAPNLAQARHPAAARTCCSDTTMVVLQHGGPGRRRLHAREGGAAPRDLAGATTSQREIRCVRRGQAIPAQSPMVPGTCGYDPAFKSEMGKFDRAKAKALLDMYGYVDRDGDGWREMPDGSPLVLEYATPARAIYREPTRSSEEEHGCDRHQDRLPGRAMAGALKAAQRGQAADVALGLARPTPTARPCLQYLLRPAGGRSRTSPASSSRRVRRAVRAAPASMPDGPEREQLFLRDASASSSPYMPYKLHVHRIGTDLLQPWVDRLPPHRCSRELLVPHGRRRSRRRDQARLKGQACR